MTGKFLNAECGMRNAESKPVFGLQSSVFNSSFRNSHSAFRNQKGFSLLELMIGMFIIVILLSVALPTYQRSVIYAREKVLAQNLWQMRRAIDQYAADKGKLPESIDKLVEEKYLSEKPVDPILESTDWDEEMGDDPNSTQNGQGLIKVKSTADGEDSEGKKYSDY